MYQNYTNWHNFQNDLMKIALGAKNIMGSENPGI
jgi:hypothetical protein